MRLGRQQTAQSSVKVWRRPPLGSTKTSFSSPQSAQMYVTILILHAIMLCKKALPEIMARLESEPRYADIDSGRPWPLASGRRNGRFGSFLAIR